MHGCYLNPRRHALKALEEAVQGASWDPRAGPLQFSIYALPTLKVVITDTTLSPETVML